MSIRTAIAAAVESTEQPAHYATVSYALNPAVRSTQRETIDVAVIAS